MVYIRPGNSRWAAEAMLTKRRRRTPFWLGKTEVTQGQWEALMGNNPSNFKNAGRDAPVEQVSWDDAMQFCRKLTERERAAARLPEGYEYTLPTEAQWEYACRAGTTGDYAGNLDGMAWYNQNSGNTTHPVAQKQANGWGLYDMHGNVWEWCRDWYGNFPGGNVTDPTGPPSGSFRVYRGGGWGGGAANCRSADRFRRGPGVRVDDLGFRLALAPPILTRVLNTVPVATNRSAGVSTALEIQPPTLGINTGPVATNRSAEVSEALEKLRGPEEGQTWTIPDLGSVMQPIPAGTFTMGSPLSELSRGSDEGPQTRVTLTQSYWLGKTEVTQGQYETVMGTNPSKYRNAGKDAPVERVSWNDAIEFCRKLTERERAAGRLADRYAYTLPTEAQWEYACRAGTTGPYGGDVNAMAWHASVSGGQTHPVGQKRANAWGLCDMHGNVWEWCFDWYADHLTGGPVTDPTGPDSGVNRVLHGGSWDSLPQDCRLPTAAGMYRKTVTVALDSVSLSLRWHGAEARVEWPQNSLQGNHRLPELAAWTVVCAHFGWMPGITTFLSDTLTRSFFSISAAITSALNLKVTSSVLARLPNWSVKITDWPAAMSVSLSKSSNSWCCWP